MLVQGTSQKHDTPNSTSWYGQPGAHAIPLRQISDLFLPAKKGVVDESARKMPLNNSTPFSVLSHWFLSVAIITRIWRSSQE
jgi:hypothetical protein